MDECNNTGLMGATLSRPNKLQLPHFYNFEVREINNGFTVRLGEDVIYVETFSHVESALVQLHLKAMEARKAALDHFNNIKGVNNR